MVILNIDEYGASLLQFCDSKTLNPSNHKYEIVYIVQYSAREKYQSLYLTKMSILYNMGGNSGNDSY